MVDSSKSGAERRIHVRTEISVPVSLQALHAHEARALSDDMHGILTDVSRGGMRLELVGPAARQFTEGRFEQARIGVLFLVPALQTVGTVVCTPRWVRPIPGGVSVGLQLESQSDAVQERIVTTLGHVHATPAASRWAAGSLMAALVVVAALSFQVWAQAMRQGELQAEVSRLTLVLRDTSATAERLQRLTRVAEAESQRLQDDFHACRRSLGQGSSGREAEPGATSNEVELSADVPAPAEPEARTP